MSCDMDTVTVVIHYCFDLELWNTETIDAQFHKFLSTGNSLGKFQNVFISK